MIPKAIVFDIEAVLDPEMPLPEPKAGEEQAFARPPYWQIVTIGVAAIGQEGIDKISVVKGETEAELLKNFYSVMSKTSLLVSYNGRGYDLPVINFRCLKYGIPMTKYHQDKDIRYRYSPLGHLDLADYLADYGACWPVKLDVLTKLIGLPGKLGVDGSQVAALYAEGKLAEIQGYCMQDVAQTAGLYLRWCLVTGRCQVDEHNRAMLSLLAACEADPRIKEVADKSNRERLIVSTS